jgi:ankyrin repeat protein
MFEAAEHARDGDVAYFRALAPAELDSLVIAKDEDGRSLLHTAAAGGHLELLELLAGAGAARVASKADDEVCFLGGGRGLRAMCLHVCLSATHIHQSNILKTTLHFQTKQTNKQTGLDAAALGGERGPRKGGGGAAEARRGRRRGQQRRADGPALCGAFC